MTSCTVLIMNILSKRHIYHLRTFLKMFKKKNIELDIWCAPQDYQEEDTHKPSLQSDSFWPSYGLRSVSECSKTEPEAPVWSKVQQGIITPLPMYDGRHCQNDGKLNFDNKLPKKSLGLYIWIRELEYQLLTDHLSSSTLLISF